MTKVKASQDQTSYLGNLDHLKILLNAIHLGQIRLWNDWRSDNPTEKPNLIGINLAGEKLIGINFIGADLTDADLTATSLSNAELSGACFLRAVMIETKLIHATAYGCSFDFANLVDADLNGAVLNSATFRQANLTGATIFGISCTAWEIDNIRCSFVYTGPNKTEREPEEGFYIDDEFYQRHRYLPSVKFVFIDEFTFIDVAIMDKVVKKINSQNNDFELSLTTIEAKGKPTAEFTINGLGDSKKILAAIKKEYDADKQELIEELKRKNITITAYMDLMTTFIHKPSIVIQHLEVNSPNNFGLEFNQTNGVIPDELIHELTTLREALCNLPNTNGKDINIDIEKLVLAEQAVKAGDEVSAVKHLKNIGKWTLDVSTKIGTAVASEYIKKSIGL